MSSELNSAIEVLTDHFILGQEKTIKEVSQALECVTKAESFEELGRKVCLAMLKANVAALQTKRAVLVAGLSSEGPTQ
ncbi:hypothetical protein SAMN05216404_101225 [Nitrosospira multiformis]|uniref:Uncharacterized protein n=1 Tax=Nitrosospira multiformis TaxID=1231 RepID=A0A1H8BH45_9PROT|nr:hypothetical protein [Nitrosospira multiformis]SEM81298.1 hypothetical protein SAMN05216404_101225 [Nitrosospira multiformis]